MKLKKLLKLLDPTMPVLIESNNHKLLKAKVMTICSDYPRDYFTYRLMNSHIKSIQTYVNGTLLIILREEKKDDETNQ